MHTPCKRADESSSCSCVHRNSAAVPLSALFCRPIFNRLIGILSFLEDVAMAMFHAKEPRDDQAGKSWEPVQWQTMANTRQCCQASTSEVASLRDAVAKLERGRCK